VVTSNNEGRWQRQAVRAHVFADKWFVERSQPLFTQSPCTSGAVGKGRRSSSDGACKPHSIVIRWVAVNRVDVHGRIASYSLR